MKDTDKPILAEGEDEPLKPYDVHRHDGKGNMIGDSLGRFDTAEEAWAFRSTKRRGDWYIGVFHQNKMLPHPARKGKPNV